MDVSGRVDERLDAVIAITLKNDLGQTLVIDAVIDSGFNDALSLPSAVIQQLKFGALPSIIVELADGSEAETQTFTGRVVWDDPRGRIIRIQQGEGRPLVGMALLLEHRVTIDVRYDGAVRVEPIPGSEEDI